jgi:hypothetical protein
VTLTEWKLAIRLVRLEREVVERRREGRAILVEDGDLSRRTRITRRVQIA